jgi:hypothetical protein
MCGRMKENYVQYEHVVVYILTETVDTLFCLCECGYHCDHINHTVDASVDGLDEDPVTLYLGYHD